ncbi:MAG: hypothetical protein SFU25_01145 [Candidatus Caenarcaniphilales bacterium]|nr:hypothetical protein [Candidatus Caenarcaniphilales bacterium]
MKKIANIVKSTSHIEYVAQVINPKKTVGIESADFCLGRFVLIDKKHVGIVYDTELFNPNSLTLSAQKEDNNIYAPDLQDEVEVLLKILLLGNLNDKKSKQDLPVEALEAGMEVVQMSDEQIKDFHLIDEKVQVRYLSNLNSFGSKLNPGLFKAISAQLQKFLSPEQYKIIKTIERNLEWLMVCQG